MNTPGYNRGDIWLIKGSLGYLLAVLVVITTLFLTLNAEARKSGEELLVARSQLQSAQDTLARSELEEATIIRHIDRFQELDNNGVLQEEDRLLFLERFAQLRARHSLFPIAVNIGQQTVTPLQYGPSVRDPGRPLELHASTVDFNVPLLHEDDFFRLLGDLLDSQVLLQPLDCKLSNARQNATNFIYLTQHFDASCSLLWYTIAIPGAQARSNGP